MSETVFTDTLRNAVREAFQTLYGATVEPSQITINDTPTEFTGDFTVVTFPLAKAARQSPPAVAEALGNHLLNNLDGVNGYNVVKGFLNVSLSDGWWIKQMADAFAEPSFGRWPRLGEKVLIEYAGPNTNKPLHLGHVRNVLIGFSVSEILDAAGYDVVKVNIYNDRGVHICKSMLAYQAFGHGETPVTSGVKGDHLVGNYYVRCENQIRAEADTLLARVESGDLSGIAEKDRPRLLSIGQQIEALYGETEKEKAEKLKDERKELIRANTPFMRDVQQMLVAWENHQPEVRTLWTTMNSWVYVGFHETFERIGIDFHKHYHESDTYLLGKAIVEDGLAAGVFFKKDDNSVWVDLTADGLDQKLLLRADGTSVYITQDIGTAELRFNDFGATRMIYTVASEQDYHFKVLRLICGKLGKPYAPGISSLGYGMVDLPTGRMKSREGTVVEADDLLDEMETTAEQRTVELGKVDGFTDDEKKSLYRTIGLGALKFFILRVDPKKRMIFDPNESIDFHGFTGPFIQYSHARIRSVLRKAAEQGISYDAPGRYDALQPAERDLIRLLCAYPTHVRDAAAAYDPANIANYLYKLAKAFNHFYAEHSILNADTADEKVFRLQLSVFTTRVIKSGLRLLGIDAPEKM